MTARRGTVGALTRALVAALVMGLSLAVATWLGGLASVSAHPDQPLGVRVAVAGLVCLLVVLTILLLRRRWDRAPLATMGLAGPRTDAHGFLLGAAVVAASGAGVAVILTVVGWARWTEFDATAWATFLVTNTLVALLLEAVPEEVAIRGYALTVLRERFGTTTAGALGIATFLLVPVIALSGQWALERASGEGTALALAPAGEDALTYYAMLAAFGLLLTYARDATVSGTVWTCIGAHIAWLTINRVVLGGASGIHVELAPGAETVFFAAYAAAAVIAFSMIASRAGARREPASVRAT